MDGFTIQNICTNNAILKSYFLGIVRLRDLEARCLKDIKTVCGNFLIINIRNLHWIALMWGKHAKRVFVFDSLGGGSMFLNKHSLQRIIFKNFNIKNVSFQVSGGNLQDVDSLTCGEHVIYWCIYQILFFQSFGFIDPRYVRRVAVYCKKHFLKVDSFIWDEIYIKFRLAPPPNLEQIMYYLEN